MLIMPDLIGVLLRRVEAADVNTPTQSAEDQRHLPSQADDLLLAHSPTADTTLTCPNASAMFAASFSLMPTDVGSKPP
jgi:hypothetical protein